MSSGNRRGGLQWLPQALTVLGTLCLVASAMGRQLALEAVSPTDLAFFHQSTWNALSGRGFEQTVLSFEGETLTASVHFSLARALVLPLYGLWPSLLTLVGLQAALVGCGAGAVARLVDRTGNRPGLAGAAVLLYMLHPWSLELACADFRPLVWLVPGLLWTLVGLVEWSWRWVLPGALLCVCAREEGPWVLAALLPFVAWAGWKDRPATVAEVGQARKAVVCWLAVVVGGAALVRLVWGQSFNLVPDDAWTSTLADISAGARPFFRQAEEARYGGVALLSAAPSLLSPILLGISTVGWLVLVVLSKFESISPGGRGIHYLAVVHPFLMGALALGLQRLGRASVARWVGALAVPLLVGQALAFSGPRARLPHWMDAGRKGGSPEARSLQTMVTGSALGVAGVFTVPEAAPWLARRPGLWVQGEASHGQLESGLLCSRLQWIVLPGKAPGDGRDLTDADVLVAACGFRLHSSSAHWQLAAPAERAQVVSPAGP